MAFDAVRLPADRGLRLLDAQELPGDRREDVAHRNTPESHRMRQTNNASTQSAVAVDIPLIGTLGGDPRTPR